MPSIMVSARRNDNQESSMQATRHAHRHAPSRWVTAAALPLLLLGWGAAQAQMVQYNEQLGAYKDQRDGGVKLQDGTFPAVSAKSAVALALAKNKVIDQSALMQPDGTLKLPSGQQSVVIRADYTNVSQDANGVIRVASPTIEGNVSGNVTLYVEGKGVQNITVLNNPR